MFGIQIFTVICFRHSKTEQRQQDSGNWQSSVSRRRDDRSHRSRSPRPAKHDQDRKSKRSPIHDRTRKRSPSLDRTRKRSPDNRSRQDNEVSQERHSDRSKTGRNTSDRNIPDRKKFDETEKEKKLREMMDNAAWRESQRNKNVEHYRKQVTVLAPFNFPPCTSAYCTKTPSTSNLL